MASETSSSGEEGCDRPFDDQAFLDLCATGQINHLSSLLHEEARFLFAGADCRRYRAALDGASRAEGGGRPAPSSEDADWRYRIARWMLRAADEFAIERHTALIALSYCDRHLLNENVSRRLYQVAGVTALFVASKLFEKRPITMASLMNYTRGEFARHEVLAMEHALLTSSLSRMYPPTAATFVLMFVSQLSCTSTSMLAVVETCQFMIEQAACDFFFVSHKKSKVAFAALLLALEHMNPDASHELRHARPDLSRDADTTACLRHLRTIFTHNERRIRSLDGERHAVASADPHDRPHACRAATPSPVPEDTPEHAANGGRSHRFFRVERKVKLLWSVRRGRGKRQRCEV